MPIPIQVNVSSDGEMALVGRDFRGALEADTVVEAASAADLDSGAPKAALEPRAALDGTTTGGDGSDVATVTGAPRRLLPSPIFKAMADLAAE